MVDYLSSISADGDAFAAVVASGPLEADVHTCPGWSLRDLAHHVGYIQRWARLAAATGSQPLDNDVDSPPDDAGLAGWLRDGTSALVATLGSVPGDAPTWHPFPPPVPQVMAVWPRRQAHELAIHVWDAQSAVGEPTPMEPLLAATFVREYFEVVVPRVIDRDRRDAPVGIVNVGLTDVGGRFSVRSTVGTVALMPSTETAPVIAGFAQDVLLALWHRRTLAGAPTSGIAAEWLAFGGN